MHMQIQIQILHPLALLEYWDQNDTESLDSYKIHTFTK